MSSGSICKHVEEGGGVNWALDCPALNQNSGKKEKVGNYP